MAGVEDREVWERRPFPLERLPRDARPCTDIIQAVDPLGETFSLANLNHRTIVV